MNKTSNFLDNTIAVIAWLGLLCLAVYGSSFHNGFLMDDHPMLLENHSSSIMEFLQLKGSADGLVYFRPMSHLLNVISFAFFGENVIFYHLLNLFLFYASGLILYRVLSIVLQRKDIALLAVIFFFVHPINGVLINYKNATGFSLLLLALNYSLLNYLKAVLDKERSGHILGLIWFALALLCHETALIFPLFLAGTLFFTQKVPLKQIALTLAAPAVLWIGYVLFRSYHAGLAANTVANTDVLHLSALTYAASLSKLIFWYLQKLVSPFGIVLMADTPPVVENAGLWILALIALVGASIYWIRNYRQHLAASFGIFLFLGGILPLSLGCLSRPWFGVIIEPHWVIYSSIGFFTFLAACFMRLKEKMNPGIWKVCLGGLILFYISTSWRYNYLWSDQGLYCRYWRAVSPYNYMPSFWLSYQEIENKNYLQAQRILQGLLCKGLNTEWVYGNLGIAEYHLKEYNSAEAHFKEVLKLDPTKADTYYFLGSIFLEQDDLVQARSFLERAVELDPGLTDAKKKLESVQEQSR